MTQKQPIKHHNEAQNIGKIIGLQVCIGDATQDPHEFGMAKKHHLVFCIRNIDPGDMRLTPTSTRV
jgi:hypothetical protein